LAVHENRERAPVARRVAAGRRAAPRAREQRELEPGGVPVLGDRVTCAERVREVGIVDDADLAEQVPVKRRHLRRPALVEEMLDRGLVRDQLAGLERLIAERMAAVDDEPAVAPGLPGGAAG